MKLLSCPFCGIAPVTNESGFAASISCSNENCPATLVIASGDLASATAKWNCRTKSAPDFYPSHSSDERLPSSDAAGSGAGTTLSNEMRRLVIAARHVAFDAHPSPEALKELDAASEAFASTVPWDNEPPIADAPSPESMCSSYLACCVGVVECDCEASALFGETR